MSVELNGLEKVANLNNASLDLLMKFQDLEEGRMSLDQLAAELNSHLIETHTVLEILFEEEVPVYEIGLAEKLKLSLQDFCNEVTSSFAHSSLKGIFEELFLEHFVGSTVG